MRAHRSSFALVRSGKRERERRSGEWKRESEGILLSRCKLNRSCHFTGNPHSILLLHYLASYLVGNESHSKRDSVMKLSYKRGTRNAEFHPRTKRERGKGGKKGLRDICSLLVKMVTA